MSRESTALGASIEKLVATGNTINLVVTPGHGQNKSTAEVVAPDGSVTTKFTASTFADLAGKLASATSGVNVVSPTASALEAIMYLRSIGSAARFFALDADGHLVDNPEFDTPVMHRQNAAAVRNGQRLGAAAVLDTKTNEVTPIPVLK